MHTLKAPAHYDKVHKDECMFSYDSPESPGGLYVNLSNYQVNMAGMLLVEAHRHACINKDLLEICRIAINCKANRIISATAPLA